jgi:hypothetical protein
VYRTSRVLRVGLPGEQASILAALAALYRSNGQEAKAREAMTRRVEIGQTLAARMGLSQNSDNPVGQT